MLNYKNVEVVERLVKAYKSIMQRVGDPLDEGTLYGPLHTQQSVQAYLTTLEVQYSSSCSMGPFTPSSRCKLTSPHWRYSIVCVLYGPLHTQQSVQAYLTTRE
jgi:hypothetical protein